MERLVYRKIICLLEIKSLATLKSKSVMAKRKLIIFDFDGVIIDSIAQHKRAYDKVFEFFGKQTPVKTMEEWKEWHDSEWEKNFTRVGIGPEHMGLINEKYWEAFDYEDAEIYEGIKEILKELSGKYKLAIVSNTIKANIERQLTKHGIHTHFQAVIGGDDESEKKKKLAECLAQCNSEPSGAIMIGDSTVDIRGGKALGLKTIAIAYGYTTKAKILNEKPDEIAHHAREIPALVEKLFKS